MPKLVEIPESPRAAHDGNPVDAAPVADRRKNERQIATFRTCCIVIDGEAHPAILRNMSNGGAMFEALVPAKPNTLLTYWWDGIQPVEARVAWVEGNRIGVANLSGPAAAIPVPDRRLGEKVCLVILSDGGRKPDADEVLNFLYASGLSIYDMPEYYAVSESFPLTASGKILKRALIAEVQQGTLVPVPVRFKVDNHIGDEAVEDETDKS